MNPIQTTAAAEALKRALQQSVKTHTGRLAAPVYVPVAKQG